MQKADWLDTDQTAAFLRLAPGTLRVWRSLGDRGPKYFKIGGKVFYRPPDVEAWVQDPYKAANLPVHAA